MLLNHDIHIHTNLSRCSHDEDAVPEKIIKKAAARGLEVIGFANHFWDGGVPGASEWYASQDWDHIMGVKNRIPADTGGVRVLIGCETEYCGGGRVGISRGTAENLDFVLVPMSHLHMKGFVEPSWVRSPGDVAGLMVERFNEVVGLGIATGIAHPFMPVHYENADEIISLISEAEFEDCFGRAAEAGVSIEVQANYFPDISGKPRGLRPETYMRVLSIAKKSGCFFHFGSDAHRLDEVGFPDGFEKRVTDIGITAEDILPMPGAGRIGSLPRR